MVPFPLPPLVIVLLRPADLSDDPSAVGSAQGRPAVEIATCVQRKAIRCIAVAAAGEVWSEIYVQPVRVCRARLDGSRLGRGLIHCLNWKCFAMLCAQPGQKIKNSSRDESDECTDKDWYCCTCECPAQELKRRNRIRRSRIVPAALIHKPDQRKVCDCARQRSGGENNKGINTRPKRCQEQYRDAENDGCPVTGSE
jgi:hypothetical protein